MQLGELGDWKSASVVQGQSQNSSRGLRPLGDQIPQKLKRYESVTQITLSSAGSRVGNLI